VTLLFQVYIDKMLTCVQEMSSAIAGIIMSLVMMWQVALPCVGVVLLSTCVYWIGDRILDKLWDKFNQSSSTATSKAEEVITSFRTVKSFDNELYEAKKYEEALVEVDAVFHSTSLAQGTRDAVMWTLVNMMIGGMLYLASWFVLKRPELGYTSGTILVLMMAMILSSLGISNTLSLTDDFKKARVSAAKILRIIESPPKVNQHEGNRMEKVIGKIEFVDVGFKYETRDDWAVRHLSFTVDAGESVALIGESGCGKSTTLQLLQRFYEIQEGRILIDGVDIGTLAPDYVRSQIAVVPQGPVLFSMSVRDNIRFSRGDADDEEIAEAATIGNAHLFVMELPQNYRTPVQQSTLSGGQKQRICISRAILAKSPILLLDEATAALDTESEQLVQQSLDVFRKGKTAIVVAHRLATVVTADRILVFKDGAVAETGTHADLLARDGLYKDLVKYQLQ
jgi:ABC-type multidrug transport system fused ATPase/permease subunit